MRRIFLSALLAACLAFLFVASAASGQGREADAGPDADALLSVPVSGINISPHVPSIKNPYASDKNMLVAGKKLFHTMNCVGCHAPEGGGGMGPPLSDNVWIYGGSAANIYLTILQGRPKGMPSWGGALPPQAIWSLVTYVQSLSQNKAYEQSSKLNGK